MKIRNVLLIMADSLYDLLESHRENLKNIESLLRVLNSTIQAFPYSEGQKDQRFKFSPEIETE